MKKIKLRALEKFVKDLAQRVEKMEDEVFVNPQVPESLIPTQSPQEIEFSIGDYVEIIGNNSGHSQPIGERFLINHLDFGGVGYPFTIYKGYNIRLNDLKKVAPEYEIKKIHRPIDSEEKPHDFKQFDLCEVLGLGRYKRFKFGEKAVLIGFDNNKEICLQQIGEKENCNRYDCFQPHQLKFIKNLLDPQPSTLENKVKELEKKIEKENPPHEFKQLDLCEVLEEGELRRLGKKEKGFIIGFSEGEDKSIFLQKIKEDAHSSEYDFYSPHQLKFIKNLLDNNSSTLEKQVSSLEQHLQNIYNTGLNCIEYVGMANYQSRIDEAKEDFDFAFSLVPK
jgi:hypothetical protein